MKAMTCVQYNHEPLRVAPILFVLFCIMMLNAQTMSGQIINYELVPSINANFENVYVSSVHFGDFDGDGDQDVFVSGQNEIFAPVSKLYFNDSFGNYSEVIGTPFTPMTATASDFSDVDGDGDLDLLLSGAIGSFDALLEFYLNDGSGNFSSTPSTVFTPVYDGDIDFTDFDNDGDEDVYISGNTGFGFHAGLYVNDGTGNFSLFGGPTPPFVGMSVGDVSISDINNDGLSDILVSGNSALGYYTGLYQATFFGSIVNIAHPFQDMVFSAIDFADVDGDGDQDALLAGRISSTPNIQTTELYLNNGSGSFSIVTGTPFRDVENGVVRFEDIEGDGDQDVLIAGLEVIGAIETAHSEIYQNDGAGNFTLATGFLLEGIEFSGAADFGDMDNDGDMDLLISGYGASSTVVTKLYRNISIPYSSLPMAIIDPCYNSHIMGDINCDGIVETADLVILLGNFGSVIIN